MKTTFMVVAAAFFVSGVAKTPDKVPARGEKSGRAASAIKATALSMVAPAPWAANDPADSLYREARAALGKGD